MPPDLDNVVPQLKALNDEFLRQFPGVRPSSGYRDPFRNAAVGGARYSRHLNGDAIDYVWRNLPPEQQVEALKWWSGQGAGGIGVYGDGSIHVDLGQRRAWGPDRSHTSIGALPDYLQTVLNDHRTGRGMAPAKIDPEYERLAKLYGAPTPSAPQAGQAAAAPGMSEEMPDYSDLVARYGTEPKAAQFAASAAPASTEKPKMGGPFAPGVAAFAGGAIDGIPVVGPWIKKAAEAGAARASAYLNGTPVEQEQQRVNALASYLQSENPNATFAGNLAGGIGGYAAAAAPAAGAAALGLVGSMGTRMAAGAASNSLIGGADSASRQMAETGAVDPMQAGIGAGIGGSVGMLAPVAGRALGAAGNKLLGVANEGPAADALKRAADFGIPIRSDQASTSPFLNKLGQMMGAVPGSGMMRQVGEQRDAFTRAVSRSFGEDTATIDRTVMRNAQKRIGGVMDDVAAKTTIPADSTLLNALGDIESSARSVFADSSQFKVVQNQINDVLGRAAKTNAISGEAYQALIQKGSPLDKLLGSSDTALASYAGEIKEVLTDALQRSAAPGDAQRLAAARLQYKNLKTIEPLAIKGVPGEISPSLLQGRVNSSFKGNAFSGAGDLGELGDIGQRFLKAPRDSGTPLGMLVLDAMKSPAMWVGAGAGAAGAGGYYAGYDPLQMAGAAGAMALGSRLGTAALANTAGVNQLLQAGSVPVGQNFLMDQASRRQVGQRR